MDKVICPRCGAEIDHLIEVAKVEKAWKLRVGPDGVEEYSGLPSLTDISESFDPRYLCPECNEVLFWNFDDAWEFLGGKKRRLESLLKEKVAS